MWDLECNLGNSQEGGVEGDSLPVTHWAVSHSPGSLCICSCLCSSCLFPSYLLPWHLKLDRVPAPDFAPLPPLWCGISLICFTNCQWSLPGPPLPLASQTCPASLQGPSSSLCFFPHWPSSSSLALRFGCFSGLSQEYTWGALFGS